MRTLCLYVLLATACGASVLRAQAVPPDPRSFATSTEVAELASRARSMTSADKPMASLPLLSVAPYRVMVEYRAGVATANVHETDVELMIVVEGSATLTTGGTLVKPTRTNPTNLSGTGIEGGTVRKVGKGDMILVAAGEPHFWSAIDTALVVVTLHMPAASH